MTIRELIEKLKQEDQDAVVYISNDGRAVDLMCIYGDILDGKKAIVLC